MTGAVDAGSAATLALLADTARAGRGRGLGGGEGSCGLGAFGIRRDVKDVDKAVQDGNRFDALAFRNLANKMDDQTTILLNANHDSEVRRLTEALADKREESIKQEMKIVKSDCSVPVGTCQPCSGGNNDTNIAIILDSIVRKLNQ